MRKVKITIPENSDEEAQTFNIYLGRDGAQYASEAEARAKICDGIRRRLDLIHVMRERIYKTEESDRPAVFLGPASATNDKTLADWVRQLDTLLFDLDSLEKGL